MVQRTRKFQERATRKLSNLDLWATQQRATDAGRGRRRERGVRVRSSGSCGRTGRCGDPGARRGERLAAARRRRRVRTEGGARGRWHSPAWHPNHAHGPQIAGVRPGGVALVELAVGAVAGGRHRPGVRAPVAVHRDSFDRRRRAGTAARWQQLPPDRKAPTASLFINPSFGKWVLAVLRVADFSRELSSQQPPLFCAGAFLPPPITGRRAVSTSQPRARIPISHRPVAAREPASFARNSAQRNERGEERVEQR